MNDGSIESSGRPEQTLLKKPINCSKLGFSYQRKIDAIMTSPARVPGHLHISIKRPT